VSSATPRSCVWTAICLGLLLAEATRLAAAEPKQSAPTNAAQSRDTSLPAVTLKSGEAQLFVDDYLIASQSDLQRTLRKPKKDDGGNRPVIAIEDEFGETRSTLEANGTILYDP